MGYTFIRPMQKNCKNCGSSFDITHRDEVFFLKLVISSPELKGIPNPTLCPDCRQQRRLARRNERTYYKRNCDLCGSEILSMYPAHAVYPVYCSDCWWSDKCDPLKFAQDIDFSSKFLEQFNKLQNVVPRLNLFGKKNENCDYINHSENSKNCYLTICTAESENIYHSKWMINCRDCSDCYQLEKSDLCYESQYSVGMHKNIYVFLSDDSDNLLFCYDCEACSDCLLCSHLRHKRFCINNQQLTEEEYRSRLKGLDLGSYKTFKELLHQYNEMINATYHRQNVFSNTTNCSGDYLYNCENVHSSFGVIESKDCSYCYDAGHMQDCQDSYEPAFNCELQYDCHACNRGKRILSCSVCYDVTSCAYCDMCHNSMHLFGCIGLKHKEYCILNKQYSKNEYMKLVPKIIEHMKLNNEFGGFFPATLSPFSYNETVAQEYYTLSKEEVLKKGFKWKNPDENIPDVEKVIPAERLPDHIEDIPDDVCNWAICCEATKRPFLIPKQELMFYRKMNLPIPRLHPDERYKRRMAYTNPRKLWNRKCDKCSKEIQTTYVPQKPERVFCEECYLKEVY